jgi:hypothetical protein
LSLVLRDLIFKAKERLPESHESLFYVSDLCFAEPQVKLLISSAASIFSFSCLRADNAILAPPPDFSSAPFLLPNLFLVVASGSSHQILLIWLSIRSSGIRSRLGFRCWWAEQAASALRFLSLFVTLASRLCVVGCM